MLFIVEYKSRRDLEVDIKMRVSVCVCKNNGYEIWLNFQWVYLKRVVHRHQVGSNYCCIIITSPVIHQVFLYIFLKLVIHMHCSVPCLPTCCLTAAMCCI